MKPLEIKPHFIKSFYANESLIRMFLSYDMLLPKLSDIYTVDGKTLNIGMISSMHWSRTYEYSWSYDVAKLEKNHLVLDAGCGYSVIKYPIAKNCRKVVGIDLDEKSLTQTKEHCNMLGIDNIELYKSNISEFKYNELFDRIFCISVLEHDESRENRINCIKNMIEQLKPGGLFIFTYDFFISGIRRDFHIDEKESNLILDYFGFENLYFKDETDVLVADVDGSVLSCVCLVYQKSY